jgi:hypothetical protein
MSLMSKRDATRRILPSIAAALLIVLGGCASVERNPNVVSPYSDKLSPYNYKEEGTLVRLVAGVEGGRFIRTEHYFPLFVQVANKSKMTFQVTRESFTLEDPLGNQYSIVPARELAEGYPRLDYDRRLFRDNRQFTLNGLDLFNYIQSAFYPAPSTRSLLIDTVSLPPRTFMEDVLYFPIPQSGLNGVPLRLLFKVRGLEEAVTVVFEVPRTLGILEKEKGKEKQKEGEDR